MNGLLERWTGPAFERATRLLLLAAAVTLPLSAAATLPIVFTVRISNLLAALALVTGAPLALRGWTRLPRAVRWGGAAVLAAFVAATMLGHTAVLPGQSRTGTLRGVAYLGDLVVGLGVVGLLRELWPGERAAQPARALAAGVVFASAYGLYQWFAQHYGWPFDDITNTLDSNGVTTGGEQGSGVFGWERIRGTFLEPHLLGAFLASGLFIAAFTLDALAVGSARRRRALRYLLVALVGVALLLTASLPAWASVLLGTVAGATALAAGLGRRHVAVSGAVVLALLMTSGVLAFSAPEEFAALTGRPEADLAHTADFRVQSWDLATDIWSRRPVLGYGPGQSAVRMGLEVLVDAPPDTQAVLVSAQGLWSSALIDAGVAGVMAWLLFLAAALREGARAAVDGRLRWLHLCLFAAAATGITGAQIAQDRLELAIFFILATMLAAAARPMPEERNG